jgi:hypothetical protein
MDYRKALMDLVLQLLSGALTVPQFREAYYDFYLEEVPDDALSDRDYGFFGELQEKLDWVSPNPSDDERVYGWISHEDYEAWAKTRLEEYLAVSDGMVS